MLIGTHAQLVCNVSKYLCACHNVGTPWTRSTVSILDGYERHALEKQWPVAVKVWISPTARFWCEAGINVFGCIGSWMLDLPPHSFKFDVDNFRTSVTLVKVPKNQFLIILKLEEHSVIQFYYINKSKLKHGIWLWRMLFFCWQRQSKLIKKPPNVAVVLTHIHYKTGLLMSMVN